MRKEYDFSKSRKKPYEYRLMRQITIRLGEDSIAYFKELADEVGIPSQSLINLYLRDCVAQNRKLDLGLKYSVDKIVGDIFNLDQSSLGLWLVN
jgi:hypothetical protein